MKLKNRKRIIIIFIVIIIIFILGAVGVYAYFTATAHRSNQISLGYNTVEIEEEYIPPVKMEPGIEFVKKPRVVNTGNVDCYVRVKVLVSDSRVEDWLEINYNKTDFYYNKEDKYYYYNKVLKTNEKTPYLFEKVKILPENKEEEKFIDERVLEGFDIYVYAESVQTIDSIENDNSKSFNQKRDEIWNYFKK